MGLRLADLPQFPLLFPGYGVAMVEDSLVFAQQVLGAPQLDDAQVDEFLSRIPLTVYSEAEEGLDVDGDFVPETLEQVEGWFRALSGASQRLLMRGHSSGLLSDEFVDDEIRRFRESVLEDQWTGADGYASLPEAMDFFDARLSSVLLVWEYLGSSLEQLGRSGFRLRDMTRFVLHGYKEYASADDLRLSTLEDVETVAALVTYAMVDSMIEKEMKLGLEGRGVIVALEHDVFPLANEGSGQNAAYAKVVHEELEHLLRGRTLDEYAMANRFVREREVGTSLEEAQFVMEHLALESRPMADGFL